MSNDVLRTEQRIQRRRAQSDKKTKSNTTKKWEFSKLLFFIAFVWTSVVIIFSMVMIIQTQDTSSLEILIGSAFAELATATGFYYSKAKAENRIKLRQKYGADVYNDSGASDA